MDIDAAVTFLTTHGRLLERRRLAALLGEGTTADVLAALAGYRNADGGYGWGLEPDLRSVTSQPVGAMHALEVFAELPDTTGPHPVLLCDWLAEHTLPDGGVPFTLPYSDQAGSAPHWVGADPTESSLQMTAQLAAKAGRLARHRVDVADHPWLATATTYCLDAIDALTQAPSAHELMFAFHFLDVVAGTVPRAGGLLDRLAGWIVTDGPTPVAGGAEGEVLHLLDFSPHADTPSRSVIAAEALVADRDRLAADQQADGGWPVSFQACSPAAALEWRGYATVAAVAVLLSDCPSA
jgi:hypothetical protein